MESFNASVTDESKSQLAVEGQSKHKGQCTPIESPTVGAFKVVAGNGTSIGTVMTLQCPYTHRAVSGGRVTCTEASNRTQWSGGVPECKPLLRFEGYGFRVAVLSSIVSLAIIIFISVIFITSCLLKQVKREEMKRRERERERQAAEFWAQMEHQDLEEHKGRNNNNNNNSSHGSSRVVQHTQNPVAQPAPSAQHTCRSLPDVRRCPQENLRTSHQPMVPPGPVLKATSHVDTQSSCALQSNSTHLQTGISCSAYDRTLQDQPWNRPSPEPVDTWDRSSGTTGQALEDPFWKCQRPLGPQSPPGWVLSV